MSWKQVSGNYQTWEMNALAITPPDAESAHGEPAKLFFSDDVAIWVSRRKESMPYFFRNCDADEVHLISRGEMIFKTDFGDIEVSEREMLLIPKGVTYRVLMKSKESLRIIYESEPEMMLVPVEPSTSTTIWEDRRWKSRNSCDRNCRTAPSRKANLKCG